MAAKQRLLPRCRACRNALEYYQQHAEAYVGGGVQSASLSRPDRIPRPIAKNRLLTESKQQSGLIAAAHECSLPICGW